MRNKIFFAAPVLFAIFELAYSEAIFADQTVDIQKQLNQEVLGKEFGVESEANLNAYIQDATKRGLPPKSEPSKYWRQGYTCNDLRRYSWNDYRDCSYYYSYYGHYWRY